MPGRIQLADTRLLKIGDGNSLWPDLSALVSGVSTGAAQIDDSNITGSATTTWSSQKIISAFSDNSTADQKYTDQAVQGLTAPYLVVDQGADGTWPNRPATTNVLARTYFGNTTLPSWLTAADEVEYRS